MSSGRKKISLFFQVHRSKKKDERECIYNYKLVFCIENRNSYLSLSAVLAWSFRVKFVLFFFFCLVFCCSSLFL